MDDTNFLHQIQRLSLSPSGLSSTPRHLARRPSQLSSTTLTLPSDTVRVAPLFLSPDLPPVNSNLIISHPYIDTGEIVLTPVSVALIEDEYGIEAAAESNKTLIGHQGKVTCLFAPDSHTFGKKYLMSGGEDCMVRMWGLK